MFVEIDVDVVVDCVVDVVVDCVVDAVLGCVVDVVVDFVVDVVTAEIYGWDLTYIFRCFRVKLSSFVI